MPSMRYVRLFGGAQLEVDGQPIRRRAAHRRQLALIAILAHHGPTGTTRERVADLLWGSRDPDGARRQLTEALFVVRKEFGSTAIVAAGEQLSLDAAQLPNDLDRWHQAESSGDTELAITTYTGPFLNGWFVDDAPEFEEWASARRLEYARRYVTLLSSAAEQAEQADRWDVAADRLQRVVDQDPANERASRRLAVALHRSGDRSAALRVIEQLRRHLAAELDTTPEPETVALEHSLREASIGGSPPRSVDAIMVPSDAILRTPGDPSASAARAVPEQPTRRRRIVGAVVGLAALATLVVAFSHARRANRRTDARTTWRVGVLPFSVSPGDSTAVAVAESAVQAIVVDLSGVSGFTLAARSSLEGLLRQGVTVDSIARALSLDYIIEGTVTEAGDAFVIDVRLADPRNGGVLAVAKHATAAPSPSTDRDVLGAQLAAPLRKRLGREALRQRDLEGAPSREAIAALTAARIARADAIAMTVRPSPEEMQSARALMHQADSMLTVARALDPTWSRAALDQGWLRFEQGLALQGEARRARSMAALAIADSLIATTGTTEAFTLRGAVLVRFGYYDGANGRPLSRLDSADASLRRAVALDSTDARAWAWLSFSAWIRGEMSAAVLAGERALRHDTHLDHSAEVLYRVFNASLLDQQYEQALAACRLGRATMPADWRFTECRLKLMPFTDGEPKEAWALVDTLDRLDPPAVGSMSDHPYSHVYRRLLAGLVSARAGDRARARREMSAMSPRVAADSAMRVDIQPDLAWIEAELGDSTSARARMRKYLDRRPAMRDFYKGTPLKALIDEAPIP
jgi:DNA-binding SARP family transcriptional activator/TolB-like protein/tetratricopeptide (TPR) repeat protein